MGEGTETESPTQDHAHDWSLRPWLLAGLLGLAGLLIHFATNGYPDTAWRAALAAFLFFGPLAAAFSLERERWKEVTVFALVAGLVMAGLAWRAIGGADQYNTNEEYGFGAGVIATVIALPLFQAGFHRLRFKTPYRDAHFFAWTDGVSAGGSLAFVGLAWLLMLVLSQLFYLLKIDLLRELMNKEWFGWTYSGICFGGALGILRNHLKILGTLQFVVMLLFSLLAVPLAVALVCFLLAMLVSGPTVLWEATESATPVLLACAAGSFVLTNAIVRDDDTDMTRSVVMRVTAFVLALGILPLTVFAAISMGTRVAQHGLSPERLWALVAIAVACAYGVAAWGAAVRGRIRGWRPYLRDANLNVAVGIAVLALFLALPILDFGGISAANQVSRLQSGKVSAKDFDYDALRWDFGDAGRRALAKLAKSGNAEVAKLAKAAQKQTQRSWSYYGERDDSEERLARLRNEVTDPELRNAVEGFVRAAPGTCRISCVALDLGKWADGTPHLALVEGSSVNHYRRGEDGTLNYAPAMDYPVPQPSASPLPADHQPRVEVRPSALRQIYVDGQPAGEPFK